MVVGGGGNHGPEHQTTGGVGGGVGEREIFTINQSGWGGGGQYSPLDHQ